MNDAPCSRRRPISNLLRRAAHCPRRAAIGLAVATLITSIAVSTARTPTPSFHDEFSYLLAGDTLANGRLTNPPHPHWKHFETFHVLQHPTYASKYPPGQGMALAAGQLLVGQPIAGIWILSAAAVVSCYWMLLGWTSRYWALLGGVVCAAHPGIQLIWGQSYWGGTLAFVGGALVFGAAGRMVRVHRPINAAIMAFGAVCLALSRPFEGFVYCLLVGSWVAWQWWTQPTASWRVVLSRSVMPQLAILSALIGGLAIYNKAVTGHATVMPYVLHEATYGRCPLFLWSTPKTEREYRHDVVARYHNDWSMDWYHKQQTLSGLIGNKFKMAKYSASVYFPPLLAWPLLLLRPWRPGRLRVAVVLAAGTWAASQATVWNFPHYIAPIAPLLLLAIVWGVRHADAAIRRAVRMRWASTALIALQVIAFASICRNFVNASTEGWQWQRARIANELESTAGTHLVFVRYESDHSTYEEWVYNRAQIDDAKIVWARMMSDEENSALIKYFHDRSVWLVEPDQDQVELAPFQPADDS